MARRASKAAAAHADHDMESSSGSEAEGFVEEGFEQSISDDEQGNSDEGPRVAQFMAESDLDDASSENESQEEESDTEGDGPSSEGASALEQLKSVPLATLAKASQALNASQKRKRGGKPAHDEKTLAAAKEAFQELQGKRKGRTTPRFAQVQEDEPANANQKYQQHEPRAKRKELEHRAHKHAPMVQSSKRAVGRARNVVDVPKTQSRDPRFDTLSGQLNQEVFDKSYSFLNDRQASEIASLRAEVTQAKSKKGRQHVSEEDREAMEKRLQSLESRAERQQRQRKDKDQVKARKESERKQRAEGKKPYFLKKSQEKAMLQEKRMEELSKDKRKLRKHQMRKEKKESAKEKKRMPQMRLG